MRKITDDDLMLLYYGEHDDPELALRVAESEELSARYDALCAELELADAYAPPARDDNYGSEVWQRISPKLAEEAGGQTTGFRAWLNTLSQPRFSLAGAMSIVLVAFLAFLLGRNTGLDVPTEPVIPDGGMSLAEAGIDAQRLLTNSVSGHLEELNIVLTQFANSDEADPNESTYATDMLVANRLFRQAASAQGNRQLAAFLGELEPLLIEMAYEAQTRSRESRQRMQAEVRDGLLFRLRTMNKKLNQSEISL
jgi:hypothetical protein